MNISEMAYQINARSVDYRMGSFQALRKELKGLKRRSSPWIFRLGSRGSVFEKYAFHWGGRTELQYNIGLDCYEGTQFFRYGVAFSLEPSSWYPGPVLVDLLRPKVKLFNEYIRKHSARFSDMLMWDWYNDQVRSKNYAIRAIPDKLVALDYFIFIGKLTDQDSADADDVLADFDRLVDMYKFVEGSSA